MCLYKLKSQPTKHRVANRDLVVYKVVYLNTLLNIYRSPYRGCTYNLDSTYRAKMDLPEYHELENKWIIEKGLHAFLTIPGAEKKIVAITKIRGEYTYIPAQLYILKCIVPKGTKYHLGYNSEIVCEQLKVEKVCV